MGLSHLILSHIIKDNKCSKKPKQKRIFYWRVDTKNYLYFIGGGWAGFDCVIARLNDCV